VRLLLPFVLGFTLIGCSASSSSPLAPGSAPSTATSLRVLNAAGEPLVFFAVAADLAPLLDPVPELAVADHRAQLVPAGGERPVGEIMGQGDAPNGGVAIYLYRVAPDGRMAHFTLVRQFAGDEIRRAGGRLVIRRLTD
jgi:hypothetical protein